MSARSIKNSELVYFWKCTGLPVEVRNCGPRGSGPKIGQIPRPRTFPGTCRNSHANWLINYLFSEMLINFGGGPTKWTHIGPLGPGRVLY